MLKTEQLIAALVADQAAMETPVTRTMTLAAMIGATIATVTLLSVLGFRADILTALTTVRFQFKFVVTITLLVPALALVWRLTRPTENRLGWIALALIVSPSFLAIACALELSSVASSDWGARVQGTGPLRCLLAIPFLSVAPLAALLYGLAHGAPTKPVVAGSVAGLASAAFAATLYASSCVNDSPLFVAAWYTTAIVLVTVTGALLGARFLRW